MKIDEVQVGETYAVSRSGYDNPLRAADRNGSPAVVKVTAIEKVAEQANGWNRAKTRNVRRLIVEFAQPYVQRNYYAGTVLGEYAAGDRYPQPLDAKFLLQPWSEFQAEEAARVEKLRPGRERLDKLIAALGPYFAETDIRPNFSDHERGDLVIRIDYDQVDQMLASLAGYQKPWGSDREALAERMGRARDEDGGSVE